MGSSGAPPLPILPILLARGPRRVRRIVRLAWLAGLLACGAGCRPRPPAGTPPPATPRPPEGLPISGFWATWDRPLTECLREHRARRAGRCRRALRVTVKKRDRRMVVSCDGEPVKGYFVSLGSSPAGAKRRRNDGRTPEGEYYLCGRNPRSKFHLSLALSYPNAADADLGLRNGLIDGATHRRIARAVRRRRKPPQDTRLGGDIFLHGGGVGQVAQGLTGRYVHVQDWTWGCIAVRNEDIEELFALLPMGTPVRILP